MRKYFYILFTLCFLISSQLRGQDVHFSQNYATPLLVNPAFTGITQGDFRVSAIYRNQWNSISISSAFKTVSASVDAKLFMGIGDRDWVSGGIMFYSDKAGDLDFSTNYIDISLAYNASLGRAGHNYISFGVQGGVAQKHFDLSQAQFGSQYNGTGHDESILSGEEFLNTNQWYANIAAGLLYYHIESNRKYYYGGLAVYSVNSAELEFSGEETERQPMKISAQVGLSLKLAKTFDLVPAIYFYRQANSTKIDLISDFRFVFEDFVRTRQFKAVTIGAGLRLNNHFNNFLGTDAFILKAKFDYNAISLGVSYDFTISSLSMATSGRGAAEVFMTYAPRFRDSHSRNVIHCPRF